MRDLFRNLLFNPVESCPPSIRRPQRAVAAWFDNATVNGAVPSGSCYTTVLTVQQIILILNSLVDAKQPVNVRVSRWMQQPEDAGYLSGGTKNISCSSNV